jgi:hypothetical protein
MTSGQRNSADSIQHPERSFQVPLAPNTPTKLTKYLLFAKNNLRISRATDFEAAFRRDGIGPDILHLVPDEKLLALGVSLGDTLRLKKHSLSWLTAEGSRKRKEPDHDPFGAPDDDNDHVPPAPIWGPDTIKFEKKWKDPSTGQLMPGGATFYGSLVDGTMAEGGDFTWLYQNDDGEMIPLPPGKVPMIEGGVDTGVED